MAALVGGPVATVGFAREGPPVGGCPPARGWTLRSATEPGAPTEIDHNRDGLLCGRDMAIPPFPGLDNDRDNTVTA
jgi:hypothetical protein